MKVSVYNQQKDIKISRKSIKETVQQALQFHSIDCEEIAVHFISNKAMCKLHGDFFNDPAPTDCISFPYDHDASSGYFFLGEVFVCPKTAGLYVDVNGGDIYNEITLYMIHGILHLLGYDDIKPSDRKTMRAKEKELMEYLTLHDKILKP